MIVAGVAALVVFLAAGDVVTYIREPVRVFDQSGAPDGALGKSELPPLPAAIVGSNSRGFPGVSVGGKTVYLKLNDVETRGFGTACTPLAYAARPSGAFIAQSNVGAESRVGSGDVHCTVTPP